MKGFFRFNLIPISFSLILPRKWQNLSLSPNFLPHLYLIFVVVNKSIYYLSPKKQEKARFTKE